MLVLLSLSNMTKILVFIALIMWMIVTLALTISVVGLFVMYTGEWMDLGVDLVKKLDNE